MTNVYSETKVAHRYDSARGLPAQTMSLWMETLRSSIPEGRIHRILDLGCGTGRFTRALSDTFNCPAVGIEPAPAMLEVALSRGEENIEWKSGRADSIPLDDHSVDLVFMSQVFHHLSNPREALSEIDRVLSDGGYLCLRNGTREHNHELEWLRFFPSAYKIEEQRTLYSREIKALITRDHFDSVAHQTIRQLFASSYTDYFQKVSRRGLSALITISNEEFQDGVGKFKQWIGEQPSDTAVYEPVDFFVFQKKSMRAS